MCDITVSQQLVQLIQQRIYSNSGYVNYAKNRMDLLYEVDHSRQKVLLFLGDFYAVEMKLNK